MSDFPNFLLNLCWLFARWLYLSQTNGFPLKRFDSNLDRNLELSWQPEPKSEMNATKSCSTLLVSFLLHWCFIAIILWIFLIWCHTLAFNGCHQKNVLRPNWASAGDCSIYFRAATNVSDLRSGQDGKWDPWNLNQEVSSCLSQS